MDVNACPELQHGDCLNAVNNSRLNPLLLAPDISITHSQFTQQGFSEVEFTRIADQRNNLGAALARSTFEAYVLAVGPSSV